MAYPGSPPTGAPRDTPECPNHPPFCTAGSSGCLPPNARIATRKILLPKYFALVALACFCGGFALAIVTQDLYISRQDDQIRIAAPRTHFLAGKALDRIRDGNTVHFDFQVTLASGAQQNVVHRIVERFAVSYDLWEERFSVTRLRTPRKGAAHLSTQEAESWCLNNLALFAPRDVRDKPMWVKLEIRAEDPMQRGPGPLFTDPGVNLSSLIEIFSRPASKTQASWTLESGPVQWGDLKQGS